MRVSGHGKRIAHRSKPNERSWSRCWRQLTGPQRPRRGCDRDILAAATEALLAGKDKPSENTAALRQWKQEQEEINRRRYGSNLYSESEESALKVPVVPARYSENPTILKGFEILSANLDAAFKRFPHLIAFGEDVGHLGGMNQGWAKGPGQPATVEEIAAHIEQIRDPSGYIIPSGIGDEMRMVANLMQGK